MPSAKLGNMWMPVFLERDVLEAGGNGPSEDVLRFFFPGKAEKNENQLNIIFRI